jgi:hypothetical protein
VGTGRAASAHAPTLTRVPSPGNEAGVPDCLQLLARAVQQFHTYPPTSPMCRSAVEALQRSLVQLRRDQLAFRVNPCELIADEVPIGRGTLIEQELARRLHAAAIAHVAIESSVSFRELSHFVTDLIVSSSREGSELGLIEKLAEHGVDRIALRAAYRPEVLPVSPPGPALATLLAEQRERRDELLAGGGSVDYLYPADKGWVRVDPATQLASVSLVDLALLANDPATLAGMLVQLTDDGADGGDSGEALSQKFGDVSTLFAALDARVARVMFAKLARAVLDLDTDRRQALLRRTILPSLLDGRIDGTVLRDFPDVDLAESLCLLLDLETAAPEVVNTALARLDLSSEREAVVIPLIEQKLQERAESGRAERPELGLDAHARRLIRVDSEKGRSFADFSAFDLSLDGDAQRTLVTIRDAIAATDLVVDQLTCLWHLTELEPNPELVQKFVAKSEPLLEDLQRQERWSEVADWLTRYRRLAETVREARPDVADVLDTELTALCKAANVRKLVELAERGDEGREVAGRIVEALGAGIGSALLTLLQRDGRGRGTLQLLTDHARLVAPSLVLAIGQGDDATERIVARILGLAGPGFEAALGTQLESRDEQTVREALRSLARIGTPQAAALVSAQVQTRRDWVASAAEQTLWHFPPAEAQREVRNLLLKREFLLRHPDVSLRLFDRQAQTSTAGLDGMVQATAGLQYRFWNPPLMRLARKVRAQIKR